MSPRVIRDRYSHYETGTHINEPGTAPFPHLPVRLYGGGFEGGDVVEHPLLYQAQHLQHPEKEITLIFD